MSGFRWRDSTEKAVSNSSKGLVSFVFVSLDVWFIFSCIFGGRYHMYGTELGSLAVYMGTSVNSLTSLLRIPSFGIFQFRHCI